MRRLATAFLTCVCSGVFVVGTATQAAAVDTGVGYTSNFWYDGNGQENLAEAYMNIDRINHVIRAYSQNEYRSTVSQAYLYLRARLFKNGYVEPTERWVGGTASFLQSYTK